MDLVGLHGLVASERAATKPNDNGKGTSVCTANWKVQDWTSLQFMSNANIVKIF